MAKFKEFIKIKKIKSLHWIIFFCLIFIIFNFFAFQIVTGRFLDFARASEVISFGQKIIAQNPVEKSSEISEEERDEKTKQKNMVDSEYRFIVDLDQDNKKEEEKKENLENKILGPITEFRGQALYPNSIVHLEINSEKTITSTTSDGNGEWTWTNYANPLEDGNHTIEMYNFSPFEISGKRDIFVQKYAFSVKSGTNQDFFPQTADLSKFQISYKKTIGDDDLGDRLSKGNTPAVYIFQLIFPGGKEFDPGSVMRIQLLFDSLKKQKTIKVPIKYEIFRYKDDSFQTEKTSEFNDEVNLSEENSFSKSLQLRSDSLGGDYVLKVTALIDGDHYVQNTRFEISKKEVLKIGALVVTEEKFNKVVVFNIFLMLLIIVALSFLITWEFRRFIRCAPIDEDFLKSRGFFS